MSDKHQQRVFCEIVAQLVIADAAVTDDERELLIRLMEGFGLSEDERKAVFNSVDIGQPIAERLAQLDEGMRAELLLQLEEAAAIDGEIGPGEAEILEEVRRTLG